MPDLTITYRDEPVGARESTTPSVSSLQPFCNLEDVLADDNAAPQCATFEDGYWVLGTDFKLFPEDPETVTWGLFSKQLSGADGKFSTPITLVLAMDDLYSAVGLTLEFDRHGPTWCSELEISWWRDGEVLHTEACEPNSWQFTCLCEVRNFDMITITFMKMSAPYRFLKVQSLTYGITRTFDSNEFYSTDLFQDTDLISDTVAVNTLDFVLRNTSAINYLFQRKQALKAKYGDELLGVYYISSSKKVGQNRFEIHSVDMVGLAEMADRHNGGIYEGVRADEVVADILGPIPWKMDEALASTLIYGHLPIASRRDNLQQVAFALSAMVCTGHRSYIELTRPSAALQGEFSNEKGYENGAINYGALVTSVRVTAHSYIKAAEATTLYDEVLDGQTTVEFTEPATNLMITGGTLIESNANRAIIQGTGGQVVLTGYVYQHVTAVYVKANPLKNANDTENEVSYDNMTLVSPQNVGAVLEACYAYNLRQDTIEGKILVTTERPGDYVEIYTDADGTKRGHLISLDYTPTTKLAADAVIVADYEGGETA